MISGWQGVVDRYYIDSGAGTMVYLQVGKCHSWGLQNMRPPCHLGDPHKKKWWEWEKVVAFPLTLFGEFYGSKEKFCLPLRYRGMF